MKLHHVAALAGFTAIASVAAVHHSLQTKLPPSQISESHLATEKKRDAPKLNVTKFRESLKRIKREHKK